MSDTVEQMVDEPPRGESSQPGHQLEGVPGPATYIGCLLACFVGLVVLIVGSLFLFFLVMGMGSA